jgi:hypothetical protein
MGGEKMSVLIEGFKSEHYEIIKDLKDVEDLGILTEEGKTKLMSVKENLHKHLKEEDEKFYPVLWKEAEQNKKLKKELDIFAKDFESVSRVVLGFSDRFGKGLLGESLLGDFENLVMVLRKRMLNEEIYLYGEYEKIVQ